MGHPPGLRILMLAPDLPFPPTGGAPMRNYQLLRHLSPRHTVTLLAYSRPDARREQAALSRFCAAVHTVETARPRVIQKRLTQLGSLLTRSSYLHHLFFSPEMQSEIERVLAADRFDVIQVESSLMANFALESAGSTVLDEHNIEYELLHRMQRSERSPARKLYNRIEYLKLRREERRAWERFDGCVLTSERERELLQGQVSGKPTAVVPNGVDLEYFSPRTVVPDPASLVFTGRLNYRPNIDAVLYFVRDIMPKILRKRPQIVFTIVGADPPAEVQRLAGPQVVITGWVPDVRPYLSRAALVVAPLRMGSGTRLKLLEGMAMGKAVVSTGLGCEGLAVLGGTHLLIANGPDAFAGEVLRLLEDPGLAGELGAHGRALVEAQYGWASLARRLEAFHAAMVERAARPGVRLRDAGATAEAIAG